MPHGHQIYNQSDAYFLTLTVVQWADVFTRKVYKDIIIDNLKYCQQNKGLEIYAYVIMSNHIHILCRSIKGDLSGTIRDFKSYTAKRIIDTIKKNEESRKKWLLMIFSYMARKTKKSSEFQFWTHNNYPEYIYSNKFIEQKVDYIHMNPVKAGIVENPEDYLYSSARNYADLSALLDVVKVSLRWKTH